MGCVLKGIYQAEGFYPGVKKVEGWRVVES